MKLKTLAFLEIATLVLVVVSIVGITHINKRVGYGEGQIHNARRYVDLNIALNTLDIYRNSELGSEEVLDERIDQGQCSSQKTPLSELQDLLVPKYLESLSTQGPKDDTYFVSLLPDSRQIQVCAPGAQEVEGQIPEISLTR